MHSIAGNPTSHMHDDAKGNRKSFRLQLKGLDMFIELIAKTVCNHLNLSLKDVSDDR